ncbi:hypothetical protein DUNSADRAFT_1580 [Dunaliella salina]|uniref:Encoded protein n=1 Tax=Dunaliella salina TaxID=3046 RepID=A0ABQ7H8G7_DUNSA|nr:hypothetical protein DUNSADRAFT_1580 [Dunaliella salina]|eukprot:KAF5843153.1 hypothetical protein DUNSADRAFT_1580 [Dunaliella salina]
MYTEEVKHIKEKIMRKSSSLKQAQDAAGASRSALHRMDALSDVKAQLARQLQLEEPARLQRARTEFLYTACMAVFLVSLATCVW